MSNHLAAYHSEARFGLRAVLDKGHAFGPDLNGRVSFALRQLDAAPEGWTDRDGRSAAELASELRDLWSQAWDHRQAALRSTDDPRKVGANGVWTNT